MNRGRAAVLAFGFAMAAYAQPPLEHDTEGKRLHDTCGEFKVIGCLTELFTDHPFHIGVGSLAPGNGFAVGPAFSFAHHSLPSKTEGPDGKTTRSWRVAYDVDGGVSSNASWRAGAYVTAWYTVEKPTVLREGPPPPPRKLILLPSSLMIRGYVQSESLKKLSFYGLGPSSSRSSLTTYAMKETIAGASVTSPRRTPAELTMFAEANMRAVSLSNPVGYAATQQLVNNVSATQAYAQFGQGVRIQPVINRFQFDYTGKLQEFAAPGSNYSFERFTVDLNHTFVIDGVSIPKTRNFNGPDSCSTGTSDKQRACPKVGMSENREGTIGFRFLMNESFTSSGNAVPFYFQPTMGGGDINGEKMLPSYADYRFRAPNLMLLRGTFEHSLGKLPIGVQFQADAGKVSMTHGFGSSPFVHSFAAGINIRAGGFPVLSVMFAWGGGEGTHTLAGVNSSLLGGGGRPSLY